tara:strand:+ start:6864 stop:7748 length:885 start_codon:yes stop_codon:yes gene_type:complete
MIQTKILKGKEVAEHVFEGIIPRIDSLKNNGVTPGLAAVLVGDDPASRIYVRNKTKTFERLGLYTETIKLSDDIQEDFLIAQINDLNSNSEIHGILVQLPLPKHINSKSILNKILPKKDVDGFHSENLGLLTSGNPRYIPCTPKGILEILKFYDVSCEGKHVVVVGRSNIVGRPLSILLGLKTEYGNATVTVCHSRTPDIPKFTRDADIIIAAVGVPEMITGEIVKENAVIIDVGINRVEDESEKGYHLAGDVDFESVHGIASALTPVPGGVGPMTIAILVSNTVEAAESFVSG